MKTIISSIIFFLIVSISYGQKIENIEVGYGISVVTPNGGLSHNIILESDFIETKIGEIRLEASYLHGGPYWVTTFSNNSNIPRDISDPSLLRVFNLGAKFRKNIRQFNNAELYISSGILGSYGLIATTKYTHTEISAKELAMMQMIESGATPLGGIHTTASTEGKNMFRPVIPFNIGLVSEIGRVKLSYEIFNNFYFSKYNNIGFKLLVGLN